MAEFICKNCGESPDDFICRECQLRELEAWLGDQNYNKVTIQVILKAVKKRILDHDDNDLDVRENICEVCHKEHLFSCQFCFDMATFMVLKKFHAREKILEKFIHMFPLSH